MPSSLKYLYANTSTSEHLQQKIRPLSLAIPLRSLLLETSRRLQQKLARRPVALPRLLRKDVVVKFKHVVVVAIVVLLAIAVVDVCRSAARMGVVSLAWDNGNPPETTVVNVTTGVATPAGTSGKLTVGGLTVGSNYTFVATNTAGASSPVTALIAADTNYLAMSVFSFKLEWFGRAGTLQSSTNLVHWLDERAIAANSFFYVTNNNKQKFYRVKI